jgi:amylosucrase
MAESIVAPSEIVQYLGHQDQPECDTAYNATLMALIWNSLATTKTDLLYKSLGKLSEKPTGTSWINYIRCHDDIGLGFDDEDIYQIGFDAKMHRAFLLNYYTGRFEGSMAKGALFMYNPINGDARLSGSLASLAGLEKSIEDRNIEQADLSIRKILLTHALILSYGGLPMIYSGDEIGMLNQYDYLEDQHRKTDNRWMHRASFDWDAASQRTSPGTLPYRIFSELQKLIDLRKNTSIWADYNNTRLVHSDNQHLLAFIRFAPETDAMDNMCSVLVLMNFDAQNQSIGHEILVKAGLDQYKAVYDMYSGDLVKVNNGFIELQPYQFNFITEMPE